MDKLSYIIFIIISFCISESHGQCVQSSENHRLLTPMVNYERMWEYVHIRHDLFEVLHFAFTHEKQYDGKTYGVFRCTGRYEIVGNRMIVDKMNSSPKEFLIREDSAQGKVWSCVSPWSMDFTTGPEFQNRDVLIYDFSQKNDEDYAPWVWRGTTIEGEESFGYWGPVTYHVDEICPYKVKIKKAITIDGNENTVIDVLGYQDKVCNTLIEGIGSINNGILPVVCLDGYDGYESVSLSRLLRKDGEELYVNTELPQEWINRVRDLYGEVRSIGITQSDTSSSVIFDLQGRELAEPVPGQPYIRGGKVLVEAK